MAQRLQDAVEKEKLADPQPIQQEVAQNAENPVTQVQEKTEPVPFVVQIKEELVELMETDEAVGVKLIY